MGVGLGVASSPEEPQAARKTAATRAAAAKARRGGKLSPDDSVLAVQVNVDVLLIGHAL
jgi:hypothetical protein